MKKQTYLEPAVQVFSLGTMQETLQATSDVNVMMIEGADVTFETSESFDSFFGS